MLACAALLFQTSVYYLGFEISYFGEANTSILGLCLCSVIAVWQASQLHIKGIVPKEKLFWDIYLFQNYVWIIFGVLVDSMPMIIMNFFFVVFTNRALGKGGAYQYVVNFLGVVGFLFFVSSPQTVEWIRTALEVVATLMTGSIFYSELYIKWRKPEKRKLPVWQGAATLSLAFIGWSVWGFDEAAYVMACNNLAIVIAIWLTFALEYKHRLETV